MKKLLYLLVLALLLVGCEKEPDVTSKGKLDPNAKILIRGVKSSSAMQKAHIYGLTPLEVVEDAMSITWTSIYFGNEVRSVDSIPQFISRSFSPSDRDYETPALKMWGTDIIAQYGEFYRDFIYGYDVYIINSNVDTIAHVPDSVINKARVLIEAAYNDSNYTEVYRLFNEAFTFIPLPPKEN